LFVSLLGLLGLQWLRYVHPFRFVSSHKLYVCTLLSIPPKWSVTLYDTLKYVSEINAVKLDDVLVNFHLDQRTLSTLSLYLTSRRQFGRCNYIVQLTIDMIPNVTVEFAHMVLNFDRSQYLMAKLQS
jgi:hypothetical protein